MLSIYTLNAGGLPRTFFKERARVLGLVGFITWGLWFDEALSALEGGYFPYVPETRVAYLAL